LAVTIIISATERLADAIVTHLVNKTVLVIKANILTELSITDLALWALSIGGACLRLLNTTNNWGGVGDEPRWTGALGSVVHNLALGVRSAGISSARIRAAIVDAGIGLGAVRICSTSHDTHLVETHMAQETVIVNSTCQHAKPLKTSFIDCTVFIR